MPTREDEIKIGYGTEENGFFIGKDKVGLFIEANGPKRKVEASELKELAEDEDVKKMIEATHNIEMDMPQFIMDMEELGNGYKEAEE